METKNLNYLRKIVPKSIRNARIITCVSEAARDDLAAQYPDAADKMIVLHNTIDGKVFTRRSAEVIEQIREKYNLPQEPTLLFIGNMEPRKNISALLSAYERLGKPSSQPPLLLVGAMSWNADKIMSRVGTLRSKGYRIIFPSRYVIDDDVPALISGAYCLVLPSFYEGFGYPPLQAVLCGTPAVVSEDMPVNEVIGNYVTKIRADDIEGITNALRAIIHRGYNEIVVNREDILKSVGYRKTSAQFLSILRQMTRE